MKLSAASCGVSRAKRKHHQNPATRFAGFKWGHIVPMQKIKSKQIVSNPNYSDSLSDPSVSE